MRLLPCLGLSAALSANALALQFNPPAVAFGPVLVGQTVQSTLLVTNDGAEPRTLDAIAAAGAGLTVEPPLAVLAPGETLPLTLTFAPQQNMPHGGAVVCSGPAGAEGLAWSGAGDLPGTVWDGSYGLVGDALVAALLDAVDGQTPIGYDNARLEIFSDLHNVAGWVECVYTGALVQTWGIPDPTVMNTEHTWPQSYGADGDARSDLHHLYPVDAWTNSSRGNLPFGEVVVSSSGYPRGGADRGANAAGITVFEPRPQHKGDCARAVLYFALRYGNREGFLDVADQEPVLRAWSAADPPDAWELARQEGVEDLQHNRNPFIDAPQLLERIATLDGGPAAPPAAPLAELWPAALDLAVGETATILLANAGDAALNVGAATWSQPLASLETPPASLAPRAWTELEVTALAAGDAVLSLATSACALLLPLHVESAAAPAFQLAIRVESESQLRLSWPPLAGYALYKVEQGSTPQGPWTAVAFAFDTTTTVAAAPAPATGFYRVKGLN